MFHIVAVLRLMTACWIKKLSKLSDLVFTFPLSFPLWSHEQQKPLIVGLVFPFLNRRPWQAKHTHLVDRLERGLHDLSEASLEGWGAVLRQFCFNPAALGSMF